MFHITALSGEISLNCSISMMVHSLCCTLARSRSFISLCCLFLYVLSLEPSSFLCFLAPRIPSAGVSSKNGNGISFGGTLATVTFDATGLSLPFAALTAALDLPFPLPFPIILLEPHTSVCAFDTLTYFSLWSSGAAFAPSCPPAYLLPVIIRCRLLDDRSNLSETNLFVIGFF